MKNEPAFPQHRVQKSNLDKDTIHYDLVGGLTKREYFAAAALQGMLSNGDLSDVFNENNTPAEEVPKLVAECSIEIADALIEKLEEK